MFVCKFFLIPPTGLTHAVIEVLLCIQGGLCNQQAVLSAVVIAVNTAMLSKPTSVYSEVWRPSHVSALAIHT